MCFNCYCLVYFWAVLHPNGIRANFIIDFNPYYTSFCKIFKTIALFIDFSLKGERTSKKNLVLNESKYDEGDLCEIWVLLDASITSNK